VVASGGIRGDLRAERIESLSHGMIDWQIVPIHAKSRGADLPGRIFFVSISQASRCTLAWNRTPMTREEIGLELVKPPFACHSSSYFLLRRNPSKNLSSSSCSLGHHSLAQAATEFEVKHGSRLDNVEAWRVL
jgi:hypothetical protein